MLVHFRYCCEYQECWKSANEEHYIYCAKSNGNTKIKIVYGVFIQLLISSYNEEKEVMNKLQLPIVLKLHFFM